MAKCPITREQFDAVLFDLDGVLTSTASMHAACWKKMFDGYLQERAARLGEELVAFDIDTDYKLYLDGKPRYAGVQSFLASRSIELPYGDPEDAAAKETVCGLGNRKSDLVQAELDAGHVEAFEGSVQLVKHLRNQGIRTAVVSSSTSAERVLRAAGIRDLFEMVVDGKVARRLQLAGKPAPDTFLKAAELLGVPAERAVVIEDAISGVQAGRRGGFGLVVGVGREDDPELLREQGADIVVRDLGDLL
jgi:beta-phosphoglucomutase family hydrolase